jgi:hypothetical protein
MPCVHEQLQLAPKEACKSAEQSCAGTSTLLQATVAAYVTPATSWDETWKVGRLLSFKHLATVSGHNKNCRKAIKQHPEHMIIASSLTLIIAFRQSPGLDKNHHLL